MRRSARALAHVALVTAAALLAGSCGTSEPLSLPLGGQKLTVIVLVVDSLMPHEVTAATPNLNALKTGGTFYDESRAVYAAETIPNHVAMMTGVYPARNGIPMNDFIDQFDGAATEETRLSIPERLTANTLFTWIKLRCRDTGRNPGIRTGATLSKAYLYDIFLGDAASDRANDDPDVFNVKPDTYWNPQDSPAYIPSPDEHTPDASTMDDARTRIADADFFFINLGDVDRLAHASGADARNLALTDTDTLVGQLVADLQADGRWANTVLFVVSDHGMDYSAPGPASVISTQAMLDGLADTHAAMLAVANGGTESIYVLDRALPLEQRQAAVRAARACLLDSAACAALGTTPVANAGLIAGAWYTADNPLDPAGAMPASIASRSPNIGDLTVFAAPTGKFGEPSARDPNGQIPGNHGHPVTLHNTFLIAGGSPWVKQGQVIAASVASPTVFDRLPEQSENTDIAPTVAWLLGLGLEPQDFPDYPEHENGFDGRILKEAFVPFDGDPNARPPTNCGRFD